LLQTIPEEQQNLKNIILTAWKELGNLNEVKRAAREFKLELTEE